MKEGDVGGHDPLGIIDPDHERTGEDLGIDPVDRRPLTQDEDRIGAECRRDTSDLVRETLHRRVTLPLGRRTCVPPPASDRAEGPRHERRVGW